VDSRCSCVARLKYDTNVRELRLGPRKTAGNERKHGITFEEAATVFADPLALAVQDEVHAERAPRDLP